MGQEDAIGMLDAFKGGGGTIDFILWAIVIIAGIFSVFLILRTIKKLLSYNIVVEITDKTRERSIIRYDKAKEYQTPEGRQKIGLLWTRGKRGRVSIEYPSDRYVDINQKGKKFLRLKKLDVEEYEPWHPGVKDADVNTREQNHFRPDQKGAFIEQIEKSKNYRGTTWKGMLTQAMPYIAITITVILMVVVFNVAADAHTQIAKVNAKTADKLAAQVEEQNEINQELLEYLKGENNPPMPEPPSNSSIPD